MPAKKALPSSSLITPFCYLPRLPPIFPTDQKKGGGHREVLHCRIFRTGKDTPWEPLSSYARDGQDLVVIYHVQIFTEYLHFPYPYPFGGPEAPPCCLRDLNIAGKHFKAFVAWDRKQLLPHAFGCELADSPRDIPENSLSFSDNSSAVERNLQAKRVRWSETVTDRENDFPVAEKSKYHDEAGVVEVDGAEGEGSSVGGREQTSPDSMRDYCKPFSRFRKYVRRDSDALDANVSRSGRHDDESNPHRLEVEPAAAEADVEHFSDHSATSESDSEEDEDSMSDKSVQEKDCRHVLLLPKKRPYVYHTRKRGVPEGPRDLWVRRKALAQRLDKPFLKSGRQCCKSLQCFTNIDPVFAFKTYKEVMNMKREDFKAFLISMYDPGEHCFSLQGKKACTRYLQRGFGFSNDLQCSVKNTPCAPAGPAALALHRDVNRVTKKDYIINFLRNYADVCGDMMPNAMFTNLPDIARKEVYEKFKEDFRKCCPNEAPPTISFFYSVWKSFCRDIRTRRNHGFAKCEICLFLKAEVAENPRNGSVARRASEALREHLDLIKEERRFYYQRCERAIRYPGKYISIVVDGADQQSYSMPHFHEKSKAERGHHMKVKCVGVLEHRAARKLWLYAMTDEFLTGANHVIEVVYRTLTARKDEAGRLSEVLYVQVDNCSPENKNRYFLGYFEMLVALGVFLEVEVSFLPVDHTHTDIDQAFSSIAKLLRRVDAKTMAELISVMGRCYFGRASGVRLNKVINYSGLCEERKCLMSSRSLGGYMSLRYFRFTRATGSLEDDERFRTQCHVKVQCRDEWQPLLLGPKKGFFKSIPDLRSTPQTETFPPDDITEVNQCLASLHNWNRKMAARILPELHELRDEVYTKRVDSFHCNLDETFELNGDFVSDEDEEDQGWLDQEDGIDADNIMEYEAETFVAIKPAGETISRFWIVMILQVVDRSTSNRARWLRVLWYSQKASKEGEFSSRYVPSQVFCPRRKRHIPYEDQVQVETVLLQFPSLNSQGYLRANTRSALRQVLELN